MFWVVKSLECEVLEYYIYNEILVPSYRVMDITNRN